MIKVQVDKVWLGKVSVRDYIYKKALRKKRFSRHNSRKRIYDYSLWSIKAS